MASSGWTEAMNNTQGCLLKHVAGSRRVLLMAFSVSPAPTLSVPKAREVSVALARNIIRSRGWAWLELICGSPKMGINRLSPHSPG